MKTKVLFISFFLVLSGINLYSQNNQDEKMSYPKNQLNPAFNLNSKNLSNAETLQHFTFSNEELGNWTITGTWAIQTIRKDNSNINVLSSQENLNYFNNADSWLISPNIHIVHNQSQNYKPANSLFLVIEEMFEFESEYDYGLIRISTNNGQSWQTLHANTGTTDWREIVLDISYFSGMDFKIGFQLKSDESNEFSGWKIRNMKISREPMTATITNINSVKNIIQNSIYVYLDVSVIGECEDLDKLSKSNFEIKEENIEQSITYFTPPGEGGGVRATDIVFLMDNSGSMSEEISAVSNNVHNFVDMLTAQGIDVAFGLCRFGQSANGGNPIIENNGILMTSGTSFKNLWDAVNVSSGGFEPGWDALVQSASGFSFRPGSQKVFIIITDETPTCDGNIGIIPSAAAATTVMLANSITVFALIDLYSSCSVPDYGTIAQETNGQYYDIWTSFDDIFTQITSVISNTYKITYKSTNPECNGNRNVEVKVEY